MTAAVEEEAAAAATRSLGASAPVLGSTCTVTWAGPICSVNVAVRTPLTLWMTGGMRCWRSFCWVYSRLCLDRL